jgi:hypothetical protein
VRSRINIQSNPHLFAVFVIFLLGAATYSNALDGPFVFDSRVNIVENPYMSISELDYEQLYGAGFKSPVASRPVANVSFALNYYFGGYEPAGYHLVNLGIHVVNGILVYCLALITFGQLSGLTNAGSLQSAGPSVAWKSLAAAGVFTVHPIQTQAVTYVVQRMTTMAVMFYLLSMLLYIYGLRSNTRPKRWSLWTACLASWTMALGSKEVAATFPLMVLLYRWYFFEDLSVQWLTRNAKYLLGLLVLGGLLSLAYLGGNPWEGILSGYDHREFTLEERLLTQPRVVILYVSQLLLPHPSRLNLIHHIPTSRSLLEPITTLFALAGIIALVACAIHFRRRYRLLSFGVFWFLGNLSWATC